MNLTLNLTAENPADVADLVNEILRNPRTEHSLRIDPQTGGTLITAALYAERIPPAGPDASEDVDELVARTHAELPDPGFTGTRPLDLDDDQDLEDPAPEVVLDTLAELTDDQPADELPADDKPEDRAGGG